MTSPPEVDYTVILVFPGFGAERENAEAVVESALDWLNTTKIEPGFRRGARKSGLKQRTAPPTGEFAWRAEGL
jgi:hypothetical protein